MSEWLLLQDGVFLYSALFLMLLGGAIGLPIPEDLPLIMAGVLIHIGKASPEVAVAVCYVGVIAGDLIIFFIGRLFGPALFQKSWFKKRVSSSRLRRVRFNLERRSLVMILVARHLFYLRTATFLTCGAVRMNPLRFILADAVAALVSIPLMVGLGYLATEHIDTVFEALSKTRNIALVLALLAAFGFWWYQRRKRRLQSNGASADKESPLSSSLEEAPQQISENHINTP